MNSKKYIMGSFYAHSSEQFVRRQWPLNMNFLIKFKIHAIRMLKDDQKVEVAKI